MIDPITALAGIQAAVALIKKVSKTVDDVSSLGPVLGKYFDAKSTATKAVVEAKNTGKKSSMALAIEIEMALDQAAKFERDLQLLFMTTGKIDVACVVKDLIRVSILAVLCDYIIAIINSINVQVYICCIRN